MYNSEGEYQAAMNAQAEAEAQYYSEQDRQYQEYLEGLIDSAHYETFGLEISIAYLQGHDFKTSGLTAIEFLSKKRDQIQGMSTEPKEDNSGELMF